MTTCPEIVEQATSGGFIWIILLALIVIGGAAYVWEKGLLGTATEGRIKAKRDAFKAAAVEWEQKLEAKIKAKAAPAPVVVAAPAKDKATRIAEANALLAAGTITQAVHDTAVAQIAAE